MKAWIGLWLLGATVTFILSARTDNMSFWLVIGLAAYSGLMWVLIVWRTGLTPAQAWRRLNEPPRKDL